jgi:hypothetical protein
MGPWTCSQWLVLIATVVIFLAGILLYVHDGYIKAVPFMLAGIFMAVVAIYMKLHEETKEKGD